VDPIASRRALSTAMTACAVLALAGCGAADRGGSPWTYDGESDRYHRAELISPSSDPVAEHFPTLTGVVDAEIVDGQFTDPDSRVPIPAQDDCWWQAVIELDPGQAQSLLESTRAAQASDGGSTSTPATVDDAELTGIMVAPLEQEITPCPTGWIPVEAALARESGTNISDGGDLLELTVVCEGGEQLIASARDM
jgi:hypothetical protein